MATASIRRSAAAPRQEPAAPVIETGGGASRAARPATAYRTFSAKLVGGLQALGGVLLVAGGLGLHLRATVTRGTGLAPEEVVREWGFALAEGPAIAAAGALALVGAFTWRLPGLAPRAFAAATAAAGIGLTLWRLRDLDHQAAALVAGADPSAEFVSYHAGFGWGAWLLLLGSVLLGLAVLTGALRGLDLRREAAAA